ncbi:ATP-binding protein [Sporosarcina soli]|uniref:ATP-binding protein n=1 Tax=Sporosarcina soli TaxID=334736 RepID=A0ABW0TTI4_9BACL
MQIRTVSLENFRGYKNKIETPFDKLTAIVGRNDIGKSTILEALDIFFNDTNANIKMDKNDANIDSGNDIITIGVAFEGLPEKLVVDSTVETSLEEEYLTNESGQLEIHKKYKNGKLINTVLIALYPSNNELKDLHKLKKPELVKIVEDNNLEVSDKRKSSLMRKAIFKSFESIKFETQEIQIDQEGGKQIWDKLKEYLPVYSLFQSDRKNEDQDTEIQDPMKLAIKEILKKHDLITKLEEVYSEVKGASEKLAELTLEKLSEMNPEIANELKPEFKSPTWESVFKFSITSDKGVPLNKRGSGVRRLILLNFFRAEAERRKQERNVPNIIYAFEEPETSQHPSHQKLLIESFIELSKADINQVILTTHSPAIAKLLPIESLRMIDRNTDRDVIIREPSADILEKIAINLGVFPDIELNNVSKVKLAICVEGKNDIHFLEALNRNIPELKTIFNLSGENIILLPMGGSTLQFWVNNNYLEKLNLCQVHIYDSDIGSEKPNKYRESVDAVNTRENSKAFETNLRELENYITPAVLEIEYGKSFELGEVDWNRLNVPETIAKIVHGNSESTIEWENLTSEKQSKKISKAKNKINTELVNNVNKMHLESYGFYEELESWFIEMRNLVEQSKGTPVLT